MILIFRQVTNGLEFSVLGLKDILQHTTIFYLYSSRVCRKDLKVGRPKGL